MLLENVCYLVYIALRLYCTIPEGPNMIPNHINGSRNHVELLADQCNSGIRSPNLVLFL